MTHFILSKKKHKIFLKDPVFPEGGHQAQCFVVIYRRNKFVQGGPLRFWLTMDGRKISKPLEHGEACVMGVKPGRHVLDVKMPYTGLVNLDKKLETRELNPGEMQVIEMAICGLTIPYTKVWDLGKMHCPIAVIEKKKEAPPPPKEEKEEKTTTTTTTTYHTQMMPIQPPPMLTTMYSTTTTPFVPAPMPMMSGQSVYFSSTAPPTGGLLPMPPMGGGLPPGPFGAPMFPTVPQTGGFPSTPMPMPMPMGPMGPMPMGPMSPMPMSSMPMSPMPMMPMSSMPMSPMPMQPMQPMGGMPSTTWNG